MGCGQHSISSERRRGNSSRWSASSAGRSTRMSMPAQHCASSPSGSCTPQGRHARAHPRRCEHMRSCATFFFSASGRSASTPVFSRRTLTWYANDAHSACTSPVGVHRTAPADANGWSTSIASTLVARKRGGAHSRRYMSRTAVTTVWRYAVRARPRGSPTGRDGRTGGEYKTGDPRRRRGGATLPGTDAVILAQADHDDVVALHERRRAQRCGAHRRVGDQRRIVRNDGKVLQGVLIHCQGRRSMRARATDLHCFGVSARHAQGPRFVPVCARAYQRGRAQ